MSVPPDNPNCLIPLRLKWYEVVWIAMAIYCHRQQQHVIWSLGTVSDIFTRF